MSSYVVYVYAEDPSSAPVYVGEGTPRRPYSHWNRVKIGKKTHNWRLTAFLQKLLSENKEPFINIVATFNSKKEALEHEEGLIRHFGREKDGGSLFNICRNSVETKSKKNRVRKTLSDAHKKKISEGLKNSVLAKESRKSVSEKLRGLKRPEEVKQKIAKAHLGKKRTPLPESHKFSISRSLKGRNFSKEHKINLSRSLTGKNKKKYVRTYFLVKTPAGDILEVRGNLNDFCEENNLNRKSLYNTLKRGTPIEFGAKKGWQLISKTAL